MFFAGWKVRIKNTVNNCDQGLENCAQAGRVAFSSPWSQFLTIRTDPNPESNMFTFSLQ